MDTCRCGHKDGDDFHPCHAKAYTCRKPATQRFYNPRPVCLAGVQMKFAVNETWACDDCWEASKVLLKSANPA